MTVLTDAATTPDSKAALATLTGSPSFELTSRDPDKVGDMCASLPAGSMVYIAHIPGDPYTAVVETAVKVREAGMTPVPHMVSRNVKDKAELADFLDKLVNEVGADRALVLGGDVDVPAGDFTCARELLETGLFKDSGLKRIGLACHPEEHPKATRDVMERELQLKFEIGQREGLDPWVVTQFCFTVEPIVTRLKGLRAQGVTGPARIGVAGPAGLKTLINFSMRCGVGNSIKALTSRPAAVTKLLTKHTPDELVGELAGELAKEGGLGVEGLHFFTFGGMAAAAAWVEQARAAAA